MVEVVRLERDKAPKNKGVDYVKRKQKTDTKHSYAHEDIRREKFDSEVKNDIHGRLKMGTSFYNVPDEQWEKIFGKEGKQA